MNKTADTDAIILACWPAADPLLRQLETDPALIDMGGKPVLQRVLEKLIDIGCRRIAVVHGNQPQRAEALLGDGERWGCRIAHYYAAEGDSPLSLLTRLVPADDRNCVLAAADTVALASLDLKEASVACCLESGQLRWSGWAVLPPKMIRWIAKTVRNRGDLEAGLDLTQSRLVMTTTISTSSIAATLDSLPHLFDRSPGAEGISRRPRAMGWRAKPCRWCRCRCQPEPRPWPPLGRVRGFRRHRQDRVVMAGEGGQTPPTHTPNVPCPPPPEK